MRGLQTQVQSVGAKNYAPEMFCQVEEGRRFGSWRFGSSRGLGTCAADLDGRFGRPTPPPPVAKNRHGDARGGKREEAAPSPRRLPGAVRRRFRRKVSPRCREARHHAAPHRKVGVDAFILAPRPHRCCNSGPEPLAVGANRIVVGQQFRARGLTASAIQRLQKAHKVSPCCRQMYLEFLFLTLMAKNPGG
jgi:hypothetical protein